MREKKNRALLFTFSIGTALAIAASLVGSLGIPVAQAAPGSGGGLPIPPAPEIETVLCLTGCTDLTTSSERGTIQIAGKALSSVQSVSFAGDSSRVRAKPVSVGPTRVVVRVPSGARTGRVRVVTVGGSSAAMSKATLAIGPGPRQVDPDSPLTVIDVSTSPKQVYLYGASRPKMDFVVAGGEDSSPVRIDVLDREGVVVFSRLLKEVDRNSSASFTWNMKTTTGRNAPGGTYRFRIADRTGDPADVAPGQAGRSPRSSLGFTVQGFIFPVRGTHYYGDGIGAGRGHQGGDVAAACGTPLLAARGGTVYYNSYQASGAGHYVVINLAGTRNESHVYMHLERPSPAKVGSFVRTGQKIGTVGTTGRSTGCHLHFEHWSAPGWYQGGTFLDPMGKLRKWDTYS
jgi:murein DD-endopeptidase MepM/ murein hydrolase activator NlpD